MKDDRAIADALATGGVINANSFETWVYIGWPSDVPKECTALDETRTYDCIDRSEPDATMCTSCAEYQRRTAVFFGVSATGE